MATFFPCDSRRSFIIYICFPLALHACAVRAPLRSSPVVPLLFEGVSVRQLFERHGENTRKKRPDSAIEPTTPSSDPETLFTVAAALRSGRARRSMRRPTDGPRRIDPSLLLHHSRTHTRTNPRKEQVVPPENRAEASSRHRCAPATKEGLRFKSPHFESEPVRAAHSLTRKGQSLRD